MIKYTLWLLICLCSIPSFGQDYFPNNSGVATKNSNYTLFKNATVYQSPTDVIKNGSLLIKEGKIVAVGKNLKTPENTTIIDLNGKL
jgi:imidazolonepropionase-like amidohydrolase